LLATLAWLKLKGMADHWLVQHTAPVRAKPDGGPSLEGACYQYLTSCSHLAYVSSTLRVMHLLSCIYQFPPLPGLVHWTTEVSALRSRVLGWTSAHSNKQMNEATAMMSSSAGSSGYPDVQATFSKHSIQPSQCCITPFPFLPSPLLSILSSPHPLLGLLCCLSEYLGTSISSHGIRHLRKYIDVGC